MKPTEKMIYSDPSLVPDGFRGYSVSLVTGCFDILHRGHLSLLEFAADRAAVLVVGINSDEAIRRLKGSGRPINNEQDRADLLASMFCVDAVCIINSDTVDYAIDAIKPEYWVKGGDYTLDTLNKSERAAAERNKTKIIFSPKVECKSTTSILNKLSSE